MSLKSSIKESTCLVLTTTSSMYASTILTCLATQIGKTVEGYVDNVVVKTKHVDSLIDDLRLTFDNL